MASTANIRPRSCHGREEATASFLVSLTICAHFFYSCAVLPLNETRHPIRDRYRTGGGQLTPGTARKLKQSGPDVFHPGWKKGASSDSYCLHVRSTHPRENSLTAFSLPTEDRSTEISGNLGAHLTPAFDIPVPQAGGGPSNNSLPRRAVAGRDSCTLI